MQIAFDDFDTWGEDWLAINDFRGLTRDDTNYYMAMAVIFEDEMLENIIAFVDMAAQAGSAIIVVDFSNARLWDSEGGEAGGAEDFLDAIAARMEEWGYRDLRSYNERLAFALTDETDEEYDIRLMRF